MYLKAGAGGALSLIVFSFSCGAVALMPIFAHDILKVGSEPGFNACSTCFGAV